MLHFYNLIVLLRVVTPTLSKSHLSQLLWILLKRSYELRCLVNIVHKSCIRGVFKWQTHWNHIVLGAKITILNLIIRLIFCRMTKNTVFIFILWTLYLLIYVLGYLFLIWRLVGDIILFCWTFRLEFKLVN